MNTTWKIGFRDVHLPAERKIERIGDGLAVDDFFNFVLTRREGTTLPRPLPQAGGEKGSGEWPSEPPLLHGRGSGGYRRRPHPMRSTRSPSGCTGR